MIVVISGEPTGRIARWSSQHATFYRDSDRLGNRDMLARLGDYHRRDTETALALGLQLPNAEADQRRTKDSATPLDASRRLIQSLVISALAKPKDRGPQT